MVNEADFTNDVNNPQVILPRVFPATGSSGVSTVSLPTAINPNLRTPYSLQYNFTIERQQWNTGFRISYVGTALREGVYQYNYNAPIPNAQAFTAKARPFPKYPGIYYVTNGAGHQYNALTVEAERQLASGLYFQSSWTWARDRLDLDYNWDFTANSYSPENPSDRHREIGPSQEIPKFRFTSQLGLPASVRPRPPLCVAHFPPGQSGCRRLGTDGRLQHPDRTISDAAVERPRPGGHRIHHQFSGDRNHASGHSQQSQHSGRSAYRSTSGSTPRRSARRSPANSARRRRA